jgi:uncharacterized protein YceH (UPF0502 family)
MEPTSASGPTFWPVLSPLERRVLGVLVEKQKTTPDAYPLSLNALMTGCNQKSNRDPVMNLTDVEVEEALTAAQKKLLVIRLTGSGRVERWRHNLYEAWGVSKEEMAVLCELLLRGPQTEGELRSRVSRMEPLEDLDALRAVCKPLAERGLVMYLTPEGRRGTTLTHGFHSPLELQQARAAAPVEAPAVTPRGTSLPPAPVPRIDAAGLEAQLVEAHREIGELRRHLEQMQAQLAQVRAEVQQMKTSLGIGDQQPG